MSYSKDYTKTYKFRTTPAQADALESYAKSNNYSVSEAIRKLLFSDSDVNSSKRGHMLRTNGALSPF